MALPITRLPAGFLSFFGVKNTGRNPLYGMETTVANVDMLRWYAADESNAEYLFANANIGNLPGPASTLPVVPNGEQWLVTDVGCRVPAVGAAGFSICLVYTTPLVGAQQGITQIGPVNLGTAVGALVCGTWTRDPFLMPAGSNISVWVSQSGGAGVNSILYARICRLKV